MDVEKGLDVVWMISPIKEDGRQLMNPRGEAVRAPSHPVLQSLDRIGASSLRGDMAIVVSASHIEDVERKRRLAPDDPEYVRLSGRIPTQRDG